MSKVTWLFLIAILVVISNIYALEQSLTNGWFIQSSSNVSDDGEKISKAGYDTAGWCRTTVPHTVLAALVRCGVYRDPYFGRNLETISYEPFQVSWWYRTEFNIEPTARTESVRLIFEGINYSANIFLNGSKVGSADEIAGAFKRFDVDVTKNVRRRGNVLTVQVFPPKPGDFTVGFVDWNPPPPDRNMGLFREVKVRTTGPVSLENLFVDSKVISEDEAHLTISGKLVNHTAQQVTGTTNGQIENIKLSQKYSLAPNESKDIKFDASEFPELNVKNPRLWWPNNLGKPELYTLAISVNHLQKASDKQEQTFGIREFEDYLNEQGHRGYIVNGEKVLIRGAGWVDDLLLHEDEKNLEAQFQYVKHLNLNAVRLEGIWGSSEKLYDLADRYGIMLMVGFSCQWEWKGYLGKEVDENFGGIMSEEDMNLAVEYLKHQVLWLREHPSIFVWAVASDLLPNPTLEKRYRALLAEIDPNRPILSSTKGFTSEVSGPNGVKMLGPYEYEPPIYWYIDTENGGAYGFNTETSPGAQPPPMESIQKMFAKEHYWPINDVWNFHCGRNEFNSLDRYMDAFNKRYGEAEDLEDFAFKAQAVNYEALRGMYEAFGIRKPLATGIVQWMLNAAWPKMFWQLYDYYLMPGGSFYGTRKANQPLNISYDYGKNTIHVVNDTYNTYPSLNAEIKLLSMDSKELLSQNLKASVGENESKKLFDLPALQSSSPVQFLSLKLKDSQGKTLADNFYWLSAKPDVLEFEKGDWYFSPIKEHADFTALSKLEPVKISAEQKWEDHGLNVTLKNPSQHVAFFIELKVAGDKTGRTIVPVLWDDNYISLLPGETKQITARFSQEDLNGEKPVFKYTGWNVK
ncbi:MAG TPA: glycoside hydrolase family 2 TIM barrel-domain containing protein [Acidobacteriota bacterium]|nr:glycoside hydrolase family 2 TIM barrel-domain containing protein [Acidobacteriota bacterium]